jgi:hypothetical protein
VLDESGELFRTFGVASVPTVLLVDANGRIVRRLDTAGRLRAGLATTAGG